MVGCVRNAQDPVALDILLFSLSSISVLGLGRSGVEQYKTCAIIGEFGVQDGAAGEGEGRDAVAV